MISPTQLPTWQKDRRTSGFPHMPVSSICIRSTNPAIRTIRRALAISRPIRPRSRVTTRRIASSSRKNKPSRNKSMSHLCHSRRAATRLRRGKGTHQARVGAPKESLRAADAARMEPLPARFARAGDDKSIVNRRELLAGIAALAAVRWSPALAADIAPADQAKLIANVDAYAARMSQVALQIWAAPEVGYQEVKTTALLQSELRNAGFKIEAGVAEIPTAFVARAGSNDGPVIAILAEMDSLPGLSNEAVPERKPIAGQDSGHACGHNLFGSGSVAAAIAVKKWLEETGTRGQIRVYGTPAEEGGGGKSYMVHAGLFKDVDVSLYWHPGDANNASQDKNLADISAKFRFHGIAAHAAAAPDRGRSALDAVEAMDFMTNYMREHIPQESRIHYIITNGGSAPNIVPEFAEVYYVVRHP